MGVGGGTSVLDLDGITVFVKRVPITDRELAHPHSTANLFDLPTSCQYGMHRFAGPGFGAWRELAANMTVTEGVLGGESESFALLHHWRVLPGRPPVASEHQDIEAVVAHTSPVAEAATVTSEQLWDPASSRRDRHPGTPHRRGDAASSTHGASQTSKPPRSAKTKKARCVSNAT